MAQGLSHNVSHGQRESGAEATVGHYSLIPAPSPVKNVLDGKAGSILFLGLQPL
jgi:hypothetical protein